MGGDDFASASASLHDLALILGDGSFIFSDPALSAPPESEPEPVPEPVPLTPEEERARIQAAVLEYARVFPFVHGTPPTKPPGPFPALVSPFEQTLSPPEVLVWLSHCPFPEMAKDTETIRLCVRLMGWMDTQEDSATTSASTSTTGSAPISPASAGNKRKATDDGRADGSPPTPSKPEHQSSTFVDSGLFSDDETHGQMHLDFSAISEPSHSTLGNSANVHQHQQPQRDDHSGFGDDLLQAFPLPDELNILDEHDHSSYAQGGNGDGAQSSAFDQQDFAAVLAAASADGLTLVGDDGLDCSGVLLSNPIDETPPPPPPKPKPILRTGPRQKRTKPAEPVQHPCGHVDAATGVRCDKIFIRTFDLKRHFQTIHVPRSQLSYTCDMCSKIFSRADALVRVRLLPHPVRSHLRRTDDTTLSTCSTANHIVQRCSSSAR